MARFYYSLNSILKMKKLFFILMPFFVGLFSQSVFFGRSVPSQGSQIASVKILPGALVGDYSGSLGSTTFSRNKGGAYMKNKSIPVNTITPARTAVRQGLAGISSGWRILSDASRNAWANFAASLPKVGVFGLPKLLSGHQMYVSCNQNLLKVSEAVISVPGAVPTITSEASVTVAAAAGAGTMTLSFPTAIAATEKIYVSMSAPLSAGLTAPKNVFKSVAVLDDLDVAPFNIKAAYESLYGPGWSSAAGNKIFTKISVVDTLSGLTNTGTTGGDIIAA